ncbi:condensation domain-containing protein [Bacillus licheniformis]|nr:condensation domain-containing protein [Bacillus licheniformis]
MSGSAFHQGCRSFEQTNYDFNLIVYPGAEWTIKLKYNGEAFDAAFIEQAAGHLTRLAEEAIAIPNQSRQRRHVIKTGATNAARF